ncbi:MAG: hypothetical protein AAFP07_14465 [Cyanobacteria bacterium J06606_4]
MNLNAQTKTTQDNKNQSNVALVEAFIEASLRRQEVLVANADFQATSVYGTNQLANSHEGVLIKVNLQQHPLQFHLRRQSAHRLFLQEQLNRNQFLKTKSAEDPHFDTYCYHCIKRGYHFNCNKGHVLWKTWRARKTHFQDANQEARLLIQQAQKWLVIRAIHVSNELMFIETEGNLEIVQNFSEPVLWLEKKHADGYPKHCNAKYPLEQQGGEHHR